MMFLVQIYLLCFLLVCSGTVCLGRCGFWKTGTVPLTGNGGGRMIKLERYNVDREQISVSGISSGGAMASQLHVIYSEVFMGVGFIAGIPYGCSGGDIMTAIAVCINEPSAVNVPALLARTESEAESGDIDAVSNMADDKVFILNGVNDTTLDPGIGQVLKAYYEYFISDSENIKTNFDINSEHCMPSDNFGVDCAQTAADTYYICNCNYPAAYHLLNHIYGGDLRMPRNPRIKEQANRRLVEFNQTEFFPSSENGHMDTTGYIYIPACCKGRAKECKLHVALHGCRQGRIFIGDNYARNSGYNEVGELNDIIILYPQAINSTVNPYGCWDWWGYTGPDFDTKSGFQPDVIKRMIDGFGDLQ